MGHIDSLRGIAALLVAVFHIAQYFMAYPSVAAHGDLLSEVSHQLGFGRLGVIVFFAISGFVICPTLRGDHYSGVRRFAISRFFRLFPAFWTSMLLVIVVNQFVIASPLNMRQVLGNIPMFYTLFGVEPLLGVYWTLEVELIFYLLCVALFLVGWLHQPVVLFSFTMVLMGISEWIFSHPDIRYGITTSMRGAWVWTFLPWNLAIMFWGGLFRMWYDNPGERTDLGRISVPLAFLVFTSLIAIVMRPTLLIATWIVQDKLWAIHEMLPIILGVGLFVLCVKYVELKNRFLAWLGTISYSLYLLHIVVIEIMIKVFSTYYPQWMGFHLGVYVLIGIAATILLSALVYYAIEKPAINVGRRLSKRHF
jgi:peptidoglycan/LPS O-acetylase OafA/YrhL